MISTEGKLILLDEFPMGDYAKKKLLEDLRSSGLTVSGESGYVMYSTHGNSLSSFIDVPITNNTWITADSSSSQTSASVRIESSPEEQLRKEKARIEKEEKKAKLNKEFPVEVFVNKLIGLSEFLRGDMSNTTPNQSWEAVGDNLIIVPSDQSPTDYRTYWNEIEYELRTSFEKDSKKNSRLGKLVENMIKRARKTFEKSVERQDPIEVMTQFKEALEMLDAKPTHIERLEKYMETLKVTGQKNTIKAACLNLMIQNWENKLLIDGTFTQYVTEEQAVTFIRKSKRGLALDLMKDFPRIIPEDVIEKFKKAEELKVFDNYVVLHYVPKTEQKKRGMSQEQAEKQRKKELERKKDPILFGVIRGSRRLYYIADWVDEHCDLTLDEFMKAIQSKPKELYEHI